MFFVIFTVVKVYILILGLVVVLVSLFIGGWKYVGLGVFVDIVVCRIKIYV